MSVCLSVCHTPVLYQNEESYSVMTCSPPESLIILVSGNIWFIAKFERGWANCLSIQSRTLILFIQTLALYKSLTYLLTYLLSKISNLCDHNPPMSQTDGRIDRRTTCDRKTALCTKVHCTVKTKNKWNNVCIQECSLQ